MGTNDYDEQLETFFDENGLSKELLDELHKQGCTFERLIQMSDPKDILLFGDSNPSIRAELIVLAGYIRTFKESYPDSLNIIQAINEKSITQSIQKYYFIIGDLACEAREGKHNLFIIAYILVLSWTILIWYAPYNTVGQLLPIYPMDIQFIINSNNDEFKLNYHNGKRKFYIDYEVSSRTSIDDDIFYTDDREFVTEEPVSYYIYFSFRGNYWVYNAQKVLTALAFIMPASLVLMFGVYVSLYYKVNIVKAMTNGIWLLIVQVWYLGIYILSKIILSGLVLPFMYVYHYYYDKRGINEYYIETLFHKCRIKFLFMWVFMVVYTVLALFFAIHNIIDTSKHDYTMKCVSTANDCVFNEFGNYNSWSDESYFKGQISVNDDCQLSVGDLCHLRLSYVEKAMYIWMIVLVYVLNCIVISVFLKCAAKVLFTDALLLSLTLVFMMFFLSVPSAIFAIIAYFVLKLYNKCK